MPWYEYECTECEIVFDMIRPISESDRKGLCPSCGAVDCERTITTHGSYSIKGNNSASVTPKKFRGGS